MQTNSAPKLAVVICSYNYEQYVGRAIESVLKQAEPRCELLVVDDGSSDTSWLIIKSYRIEKSFKLINGGQVRAANFAVEHTIAPHILFLDSDDELAPGSLAQLIDQLDPSVTKLQFALMPIDSKNRVLGPPAPSLNSYRERAKLIEEIAETGTYASPPTSGNVLSRNICKLLSEVDYESSIDGVTLLAAPFFGDVISLSTPLGFYRLHDRGLSGTSMKPTAEKMRHGIELFVRRLEHLERIIAPTGAAFQIADKRAVFFALERAFYEVILDGRRPSLSDGTAVLQALSKERKKLRHKLTLLILVIAGLVAPNTIARKLIAYRMRPIKRTWFGLLHAISEHPILQKTGMKTIGYFLYGAANISSVIG